MTETQKILAGIANALSEMRIDGRDLDVISRTLNGVPEYYQNDAVMAFLEIGKQKEEKEPEDYAFEKTIDSVDYSVGDEVVCKDTNMSSVIVSLCTDGGVLLMRATGEVEKISIKGSDKWQRTGRNFPAIQAILDKIRK